MSSLCKLRKRISSVWIPEEKHVKILSKALCEGNSDKVLATLRHNEGSIDLSTFEEGLSSILLLACVVGDIIVMKPLLSLSFLYYNIDRLYCYTLIPSTNTNKTRHFFQIALVSIDHPSYSRTNTLLHLAAEGGHVDAVALLIKHGATVDAVNCCGRTPLMLGIASDDIVKYLIELGADVNHQDEMGYTALILLVFEINFESLLPFLLGAGANPKLFDKYGKSVVHYASERCGCLLPLIANGILDDVEYTVTGGFVYANRPVMFTYDWKPQYDSFAKEIQLLTPLSHISLKYSEILADKFRKRQEILLSRLLSENVSKGLHFQWPAAIPVYDNRQEAHTPEELSEVVLSAENPDLEFAYQLLLFAERLVGNDEEITLRFLLSVISYEIQMKHFDKAGLLIMTWLEKVLLRMKSFECTPTIARMICGIFDCLLSFPLLLNYDINEIYYKLAKCVKLHILNRSSKHIHPYINTSFFNYRESVLPSCENYTAYDRTSSMIANRVFTILLHNNVSNDVPLHYFTNHLFSIFSDACVVYVDTDKNDNYRPVSTTLLTEVLNYTLLIHESISTLVRIIELGPMDIVNFPVTGGTYLLHLAVEKFNVDLVKLLLEEGAHQDAVNMNGYDPVGILMMSYRGLLEKRKMLKLFSFPFHLTCLAAKAIIACNISYRSLDLPLHTKKFISLHDKDSRVYIL